MLDKGNVMMVGVGNLCARTNLLIYLFIHSSKSFTAEGNSRYYMSKAKSKNIQLTLVFTNMVFSEFLNVSNKKSRSLQFG